MKAQGKRRGRRGVRRMRGREERREREVYRRVKTTKCTYFHIERHLPVKIL